MKDVVQQLRVEVSETVNGRVDMLNCINTALQNVSARSTASLPYAISDLIPRNWEGSDDTGKFRNLPALEDASVIRRSRNNASQR